MQSTTRLWRSVLFMALAAAPLAAAEPGPAASDYEKLSAIYSPPGTPSIVGKQWVTIYSGPANSSFDYEGWLVNEVDQSLQLLGWSGQLHEFRRPKPEETRPSVKLQPGGGVLLDDANGADHSVAWKVTEGDYLAKSREELLAGFPNQKYDQDVYGFLAEKQDKLSAIVTSARHAHYAHLLGEGALADAWYAEASQRKQNYTFGGDPNSRLPLLPFLAEEAAANVYYQAIFGGHDGDLRGELLKRWRHLAEMPAHKFRATAQEMVKHYEQLLAEDDQWREPSAAERAKYTSDQWVDYWLYHLRDWDAGQRSSPGYCNVFYLSGTYGSKGFDKDRPNPAEELVKLGKSALPKVIALIDDRRPTRCKTHSRYYNREGQYLLRYGDCCVQIYQQIRYADTPLVKRGELSFCPTKDDEEKACKVAAEKWWREVQLLPPPEE